MTARLAVLLLLTLCAAPPSAAQSHGPRHELGAVALTMARTPTYIGLGLYAALRPGGNARVALTVVPGGAGGESLVRGELLAHFVLSPRRMRGASPYALGGIAGVTGAGTAGYLVLGVGLESAPGRRSGWALEGGVGGGVRLTAGWRWRW